jgi:amino acid transporter
VNRDGDGPSDERLKRDIGALGVCILVLNGVVGAGIFALPGALLDDFGVSSPYVILFFGLLILLVALPIAEAASFFESTGGPVAYTRHSFGPHTSFQVGWIYYIGRISSNAANSIVFVAYAASIWPAANTPIARSMIVAGLFFAATIVNVAGVKKAIRALDAISLLKIAPILILALIGLAASHAVAAPSLPGLGAMEHSGAVIFYVFLGFEGAVVAAGETKDPRRTIPRMLIVSLLSAIAFFFIIQLAYVSMMPDKQAISAPLVAFGRTVLGPAGAIIVTLAALVSIAGNILGSMTTAPRLTFALAASNSLPRWFARVNTRYATPAHSIIFAGLLATLLAGTGTFAFLAVTTTLSRIVVYLATIAALPGIRRVHAIASSGAVEFRRILRSAISIAICLWVAYEAPRETWLGLLALLCVGILLYFFAQLTIGKQAVNGRRTPPT